MNKLLFKGLALLPLLFIFSRYTVMAQTTGPVETRLTDSICKCVTRIDTSKITNKDEAIKAYTDCVMQHADMLPDLAEEKKVDMTDQAAMRDIGIEIGKNLLKQKCVGFTHLSAIMAKTKVEAVLNTTTGTFKRVDNKGFNYIILKDAGGNEKSFLWLRQFAGSEKFTGPTVPLAGKKIKVTWNEIEVYLPQAKGYYKVKEITEITFL